MKRPLFAAVEDYLRIARRLAQDITETTARKAKETARVAKIRLEIARLEGELSEVMAKLGSRIYEMHGQGQKDVFEDAEVQGYLTRMKELEEKISLLEKDLEAEKAGN